MELTYESFKEVLRLYQNKVDLSRVVAAGYDSSNVNHSAEEANFEEQFLTLDDKLKAELKKLEITCLKGLKAALYRLGVTEMDIFSCQAVNILNENGVLDRNPNYAKPIQGSWTFDDCYCLKELLYKTFKGEIYDGTFSPFEEDYKAYNKKAKTLQVRCEALNTLVESYGFSRVSGFDDQAKLDKLEKKYVELCLKSN